MDDIAVLPWLIVVFIGAVALGVALAYGMWRNTKRTEAERAQTQAATRAEYKREDT